LAAPAVMGARVRTIGTKRAMTIANAPALLEEQMSLIQVFLLEEAGVWA
jgi:hypothetical protein